MQSDVNKICPPVKKQMFPVNQVIGIKGMINPNIIAFEHALGQIQNKLSLPEYNGPENFEDQEEYEVMKIDGETSRNECQTLTCTEYITQHTVLRKLDKEQKSLRETGRKCRLLNATNVENKKKLRHDLKIHNSIPMKVTPQYVAMKQMTLDKYSFQSNLLKTFTNSSCTITISEGISKSFDCKSFSNQNILFMRNSSHLQHLQDNHGSLQLPNLNSDTLSLWTKMIIPLENDPESVALESKLCLTGEDVSDTETSCNGPIDNDSLDINIEKAMEKFEVDSSPILSYKETGVQTTPPQVHACNCLAYHQCKAFEGLANKRCTASRSIAALDLDTLHHVKNLTQQSVFFEKNVLQKKELHKTSETTANDLLSVNNKTQLTTSNSSRNAPEISEIALSLESKEVKENDTKQENAQTVNYIENDNLYTESLESRIHPHASSYIYSDNGCAPGELENLNDILPQADQAVCDTKPCRPQESFRTDQNNLLSKQLDKMCDPNVGEKDYCSVQICKCSSFVICNENKEYDTFHSGDQNEDLDWDIPQASENKTETGMRIPTDASSWSNAFQWKELPKVSEIAAERPYEDFLSLKPATQKFRRIGLSKKDKTSCLHPKRNKK